jgi:hypothetical protein
MWLAILLYLGANVLIAFFSYCSHDVFYGARPGAGELMVGMPVLMIAGLPILVFGFFSAEFRERGRVTLR